MKPLNCVVHYIVEQNPVGAALVRIQGAEQLRLVRAVVVSYLRAGVEAIEIYGWAVGETECAVPG